MSPVSRIATTALVAALLISCLPRTLTTAADRLSDLARYGSEDAARARARNYGGAYTEAIERIKSALPTDADYLLVNGALNPEWVYAVRFDLAPRKCRYLGGIGRARVSLMSDEGSARDVLWIVIAREKAAPFLVPTATFGSLGGPRGERVDDEIPCALDVPAESEKVRGPLVVQGWCQERGGRPCPTVRLFLDGFERPSDGAVRYERPDVERAIPGIGACGTAGYRITLPFTEGDAGGHEIEVVVGTADGRVRRLGPRPFTWRPE